MINIEIKTFQSVKPESVGYLNQIKQTFGSVPNMFFTAANSPAALESLWGSFTALSKGHLKTDLTELIAVAIANYNRCEYCLSAHTLLGQKAGLTPSELLQAQHGVSSKKTAQAVLDFVLAVVENAGQSKPEHINQLKAVGFDDEAIVEVLAHVALNVFTNYINIAFSVPNDFPAVELVA